jgi:hypothetical protein
VTVDVSGLSPCTTYYYQIVAENEANEEVPSLGGDQSFTTGGISGVLTARFHWRKRSPTEPYAFGFGSYPTPLTLAGSETSKEEWEREEEGNKSFGGGGAGYIQYMMSTPFPSGAKVTEVVQTSGPSVGPITLVPPNRFKIEGTGTIFTEEGIHETVFTFAWKAV